MNITKLELLNFRNYKKIKLENFSNLNIFIGQNGIGKTSILESIYVGSLATSFKTNSDIMMINEKKDFLKIKISLYEYPTKKNLEIFIDNKGKKSKINGVIQRRLSDYIAQYKVLLLSPDELKIIKASPSVRRNYINIELSQLHKEYIKLLNDYNILIKNKNDYLKKIMINSIADVRYLDMIDEKISELNLEIYNYRKDYIDKINSYINKIFKKFKKNDEIKINYISDIENKNKEKILKEMKKVRNKEISLGMSTYGIHRDDIIFEHNGVNAKEYSSQGIQKLIILSMKLSELEVFINYYDIKPILLLDDLFSELDNLNKNKIFTSLNNDIQIFITTTDIKNINKKIIEKSKIFNLDERMICNE